MKLTALDGGGARSTLLAKSLAYNARHIGLTEVVSFNNSVDSLAMSDEIARYVSNIIRPDIQFSTTTSPAATLQDANYIVTILRVGGDESRVHDKRIALQHNTLGQKTTGTDSFAMAMRSISAILRHCRLTEEHAAENATLFNLTNPSGLVTEAIVKSGFKRRVYGICDAPSELIRELPAILGCEEHDLSVECRGLNHSSWSIHLTVRGGEAAERLTANPGLYQKAAMQYFSPGLVRLCNNQFFNEYFYYYYYREVALKTIQEVGEMRGEQITCANQEMREALYTMDTRTWPEVAFTIRIQHHLRRENSYMQNESQQEKFHTREPLALHRFIEEPDAGGYAGVVLDILEAVNSTTTKRVVVSARNHDTLDLLRPDDAIEINCDLSRNGLKPVTSVKMPTAQKNMISCVEEHERPAAAATLQQDKSLVVQALMTHPLIGSYSLTKTLIEAYLDDEWFVTWQ